MHPSRVQQDSVCHYVIKLALEYSKMTTVLKFSSLISPPVVLLKQDTLFNKD